MKRLSLLFLIFSLFFHFYPFTLFEGRLCFSYSQQLDRWNISRDPVGTFPTKSEQNQQAASEEEYLKYEGENIGKTPNMFNASLRMITVLLVLLALFFSVIFFLKRFQQRRNVQEKGAISVLCRLPVGKQESILMVDVMGEILVLGVTTQRISLLFKVEEGKIKSFQESQTSKGHQFVNHLKSEQENIKVATVLESLRTLRDKLRKA